jgi:hypothetical protein
VTGGDLVVVSPGEESIGGQLVTFSRGWGVTGGDLEMVDTGEESIGGQLVAFSRE